MSKMHATPLIGTQSAQTNPGFLSIENHGKRVSCVTRLMSEVTEMLKMVVPPSPPSPTGKLKRALLNPVTVSPIE